MDSLLWSLLFLCGAAYIEASSPTPCQYVAPKSRKNCGWGGITQAQCEQRDCCFDSRITGTIWCYKRASGPTPCRYVAPKSRKNCGWGGITQAQCEQRDCCFDSRIKGTIWCYKKASKYVLIAEEVTESAARQKCLSMDMHLVRIDSPREQRRIEALLARRRVRHNVWTDGVRVGSSNTFVWHSQRRGITYSYWDHGEPNNWFGWQNCIQMRHDRHWHWDDERCDHKKYALCERD